jgi:hypothetical protein
MAAKYDWRNAETWLWPDGLPGSYPGFTDFPRRTSAEIPSRASFRATDPPEFDSLIVPVRGLFPPTERRPLLGRVVPAMIPGANG